MIPKSGNMLESPAEFFYPDAQELPQSFWGKGPAISF